MASPPVVSQPAFQLVPLGDGPESGAGHSEAELIVRARTSPDSFAVLYRRHYPAIVRYIRRRVGDEHIASDLVAETFMTALEHLPTYQDRGLPFRSWLYRLATSRVSRWARRLPRNDIQGVEEMALEATRARHAGDPRTELARRALLSLPARYQDTLALHYLEGLSVEEVARALDTRVGTIKARLARGRDKLRSKLAPYAEEFLR